MVYTTDPAKAGVTVPYGTPVDIYLALIPIPVPGNVGASCAKQRGSPPGTTTTSCAGSPSARFVVSPWSSGAVTTSIHLKTSSRAMLDHLGRVADEVLGAGNWSVDRHMRQIPDHFHAHARDPHWWMRRFGGGNFSPMPRT